jgi:monofunctional biosynthetic peptidoglycan transglycosylase
VLKSFAIVGAALVLWLFAVWPPPIWYRWSWPRQTAFMAMRGAQASQMAAHPQRRLRNPKEGDRLERLYAPRPMAELSPWLRSAVLIAEDHRFYEHGGIDFDAIRKAMGYRRDEFSWTSSRDRADFMRAFAQAWRRRERIRGASTITQQLAKNLYLSPSRNPLRKFKEALTAYRLEWALGKDRVLELYLNVVEFGPEIWGVEAASHAYFNRPAQRLSIDQAAALAGTLPFPLKSNPGYRPGRMRWRQALILRRIRGEPITVPPDTGVVETKTAEVPDTTGGR